jgi:glucose/arabinose dehydrogenase
MLRICLPLLAALACNGSVDVDEDPDGNGPPAAGIRLEEVVSGLQRPVHLTAPAGDTRLFIVEQPGRIRIVENGQLRAEPFLDIVSRVGSDGNEQGLLSMAFHPDYATNGYFYVNYTDTGGDTRVERYRVSADRNRADAASATLVIGYDQPYQNHNGGHLQRRRSAGPRAEPQLAAG